jgi:hypothetical protein
MKVIDLANQTWLQYRICRKDLMRRNKTKTILIILGVIVTITIAFAFLNQINSTDQTETKMLTKYGLNDLSVKEIVDKLERITDEKDGLNASITATTLILYDNEEKFEFKLPTEEFYVSIAPFINESHLCQTHNLVSCRGELSNKEFEISIVKSDGVVILNQKMKSLSSGFIGIWLPKGIDATLTVNYEGLTVSSLISTYDTSNTCITTPLKLI